MNVSFGKKQLDRVGRKIRHGETLDEKDENILSEFRLAHKKILTSFSARYMQKVKKLQEKHIEVIFAQRLKRRDTIFNKLRFHHSKMSIVRMHDIAGGRLIFSKLSDLMSFFEKESNGATGYRRLDPEKYHYIDSPRATGYRGIHCIYEEDTTDKVKAKIEIQYRTMVQHAWATALEIWDANFGSEVKFGLEKEETQRFFALVSELLWRKCDLVDESDRGKYIKLSAQSPYNEIAKLSDSSLYAEIIKLDKSLSMVSKLKSIKKVKNNTKGKYSKTGKNKYFILLKEIATQGATSSEPEFKLGVDFGNFNIYFEKELSESKTQNIVLVNTTGKLLKKAYNNYFQDLTLFMKYFKNAMEKTRANLGFIARIFSRKIQFNENNE